jgi:hypothetical protein
MRPPSRGRQVVSVAGRETVTPWFHDARNWFRERVPLWNEWHTAVDPGPGNGHE